MAWDREGIERVTEIHHTTIMHWIRDADCSFRDAPESKRFPESPTSMSFRHILATSATVLDLDGSEPAGWHFGMGDWRS